MLVSSIHSDDDAESKVEQLYPAGDVTVVCQNGSPDTWRTWLVSSHILSIASPKFAALFRFMLDGSHQEQVFSSTFLTLNDEDPAFLGLLFEVLHFRQPQIFGQPSLKMLAQLAILGKKYSCSNALRPWSSHWLEHAPSPATLEEHGYALIASHLYRNEQYFARYSTHAIRNLKLDFAAGWSEDKILRCLPSSIRDGLKTQISAAMDQIRSHVESMVEFHQGLENAYLLNGLICLICGTTHPDTAKKCHACKNQDLYSKICTPAHRIGEYFTALWSAGLWPPSEASRACSITEYATRIASLKFSLKHRCEVGKLCPLELGLELLNVKVQTTISSITGCALHNPDGNHVDNTA